MKKDADGIARKFGYLHVGRFVQVGDQALAWAIVDEPYNSPTRALHIQPDGNPAYEQRFNYTGDFQGDGMARARARWNDDDDFGLPIAEVFKIRPDGTRVD